MYTRVGDGGGWRGRPDRGYLDILERGGLGNGGGGVDVIVASVYNGVPSIQGILIYRGYPDIMGRVGERGGGG